MTDFARELFTEVTSHHPEHEFLYEFYSRIIRLLQYLFFQYMLHV